MIVRKHLLAIATLAALGGLTACGGGADTAEPAAAGPEAALSTLRAKAQAIRAEAITADQAAEQLLDFAESSIYSVYFPSHQTTQTFTPFRFRYYPQSGVYLGVVTQQGTPYTYNGVYVMGGPFGAAPTYVGQLTAFITPVEPGPGPGGGNNGCFDLALMDTAGTRIVLDYRYSGAIGGDHHSDTLVGSLTSFEGASNVRETTTKVTGTETSSAGSSAIDMEVKNYARRTGDAELTHHGLVSTSTLSIGGFALTTTTKFVWSPLWVDKMYALAEGESMTDSHTGTMTTTGAGLPGFPGGTTSQNVSITTTTKYVGRESVTVPAGTYNACKYESRESTTPNDVTTSWYIVGKGISAKTITTENGAVTQTIEATSIQLNGSAL